MRLLRSGLVIALVAALACACGSKDTGPDMDALASALSNGDFGGVSFAGGQSSDAVSKQYAAIIQGVGATPSVSIGEPQINGDKATAPVTWSWPLSEGGWSYQTTATAEHTGGQWLIDWSPSVVQPKLTQGDVLRTVTVQARRADIIGAHGIHLVTDRPVVEFGIDRSKLKSTSAAVASARRLAALLGLDANSYAARVKASGTAQFVDAITYRTDQAPSVASKMSDIPGALALKAELPLAPTKEFASSLLGTVGPVTADLIKQHPDTYHVGDIVGLSGLEARYDAQLRGSPGSAIEIVTPQGGTTVVHKVSPASAKPLRISLDERLQNVAENLLANVKPASALVALRPSTGQILAAANGPADGAADLATYGQAPPGSTFKTFDSLALIRQGMGPDSPVS
ncbi:MAG: penicillin-binding transpeptidase domain-containing protein, partial [Microbacteriaceae bacterium]|nr:penicillin-binding transpeptidase domain-containing protein [Microbacteriaceae bacterium]